MDGAVLVPSSNGGSISLPSLKLSSLTRSSSYPSPQQYNPGPKSVTGSIASSSHPSQISFSSSIHSSHSSSAHRSQSSGKLRTLSFSILTPPTLGDNKHNTYLHPSSSSQTSNSESLPLFTARERIQRSRRGLELSNFGTLSTPRTPKHSENDPEALYLNFGQAALPHQSGPPRIYSHIPLSSLDNKRANAPFAQSDLMPQFEKKELSPPRNAKQQQSASSSVKKPSSSSRNVAQTLDALLSPRASFSGPPSSNSSRNASALATSRRHYNHSNHTTPSVSLVSPKAPPTPPSSYRTPRRPNHIIESSTPRPQHGISPSRNKNNSTPSLEELEMKFSSPRRRKVQVPALALALAAADVQDNINSTRPHTSASEPQRSAAEQADPWLLRRGLCTPKSTLPTAHSVWGNAELGLVQKYDPVTDTWSDSSIKFRMETEPFHDGPEVQCYLVRRLDDGEVMIAKSYKSLDAAHRRVGYFQMAKKLTCFARLATAFNRGPVPTKIVVEQHAGTAVLEARDRTTHDANSGNENSLSAVPYFLLEAYDHFAFKQASKHAINHKKRSNSSASSERIPMPFKLSSSLSDMPIAAAGEVEESLAQVLERRREKGREDAKRAAFSHFSRAWSCGKQTLIFAESYQERPDKHFDLVDFDLYSGQEDGGVYGPSDKGAKGAREWMKEHRCGPLCRSYFMHCDGQEQEEAGVQADASLFVENGLALRPEYREQLKEKEAEQKEVEFEVAPIMPPAVVKLEAEVVPSSQMDVSDEEAAEQEEELLSPLSSPEQLVLEEMKRRKEAMYQSAVDRLKSVPNNINTPYTQSSNMARFIKMKAEKGAGGRRKNVVERILESTGSLTDSLELFRKIEMKVTEKEYSLDHTIGEAKQIMNSHGLSYDLELKKMEEKLALAPVSVVSPNPPVVSLIRPVKPTTPVSTPRPTPRR